MSTTVVSPPAKTTSPLNLNHVESLGKQISLSDRLASYSELAKPRIALMVLLSMGVGYLLGSRGSWQLLPLLHAGFGVVLAVISASAFNQAYEHRTDAKMLRTEDRPLPSGRLSIFEVVVFASLCSVVSFVYLVVFVNMQTALLTAATTLLYAAIYTPLKRYTSFCTAIGAIPGAAPPVLGWVAAGASLDIAAFSLFAILFVWQFPHFLAIAWMYKEQYAAAGLRMVPGYGRKKIVGAVSLGYALVLIPISLIPSHFGLAGGFYEVIAMVLGVMYAAAAVVFFKDESRRNARRLLLVSLVYLPGILLAMTVDHLRLLN